MRRRLVPVLAVLALVAPLAPAHAADGGTETVAGEVQRIAVELKNGSALSLTFVVPERGEAVRVDNEDLDEVDTGAIAEVEVPADREPLVVTEPEGAADVQQLTVLEEAPAPTTRTGGDGFAALVTGTRPVHVSIGRIPGLVNDGVTAAQLATEITDEVAPMWSDSTNGQLTFSAGPQANLGTYGWNTALGCSDTQILNVLKWAAQESGSGATPGSRKHSVFYTPEISACAFAGVAHVADGGSAWINGTYDEPRWVTTAHELGHTVTLGHSDSHLCSDYDTNFDADGDLEDCFKGDYGDAYDFMGLSSGGAGPLSGAHLDRLGLLSPTSSTELTGSGNVTLAPVGGLAGLRFLTFTTNRVTYHVEYRGAVGRDADLATSRIGLPWGVFADELSSGQYTPGVVVRRVGPDSVRNETMLLDAGVGDPAASLNDPWFVLPVGRTFTTVDGAYKVKVVSAGASAQLQVTFDATAAQRPFEQIVASADFTGDRRADAFTVDQNGRLHLHPGTGTGALGKAKAFDLGWDDADVYAPGDWNGDGKADLMTTDPDGALTLYRGSGAATFSGSQAVGHGWFGFRIIPAGNVNGVGSPDLLAIDSAGKLWLYPGAGGGLFGKRIQVGMGWSSVQLYAAGDANKDGKVDILGIDAKGNLFFYAGIGGGFFAKRIQVGQKWGGFAFASGADFNRDGYNDLLGRNRYGDVYFYPGRLGGTFAAPTKVAKDW